MIQAINKRTERIFKQLTFITISSRGCQRATQSLHSVPEECMARFTLSFHEMQRHAFSNIKNKSLEMRLAMRLGDLQEHCRGQVEGDSVVCGDLYYIQITGT